MVLPWRGTEPKAAGCDGHVSWISMSRSPVFQLCQVSTSCRELQITISPVKHAASIPSGTSFDKADKLGSKPLLGQRSDFSTVVDRFLLQQLGLSTAL